MSRYGGVSLTVSPPNSCPLFVYLVLKLISSDKTKSLSVKRGLSSDFRGFPRVGVERFELPTPCSQSRCANRTAPHPDN